MMCRKIIFSFSICILTVIYSFFLEGSIDVGLAGGYSYEQSKTEIFSRFDTSAPTYNEEYKPQHFADIKGDVDIKARYFSGFFEGKVGWVFSGNAKVQSSIPFSSEPVYDSYQFATGGYHTSLRSWLGITSKIYRNLFFSINGGYGIFKANRKRHETDFFHINDIFPFHTLDISLDPTKEDKQTWHGPLVALQMYIQPTNVSKFDIKYVYSWLTFRDKSAVIFHYLGKGQTGKIIYEGINAIDRILKNSSGRGHTLTLEYFHKILDNIFTKISLEGCYFYTKKRFFAEFEEIINTIPSPALRINQFKDLFQTKMFSLSVDLSVGYSF